MSDRDVPVTEEPEEPENVTDSPDTSTGLSGFELTMEAHRLAGSRYWEED